MEDVLRAAFVEMLFALAVSQVAIHTADLVGITQDLQGRNVVWQDKLPALAHLVMGLVLIAASWIGWRQSVSPGMKKRVEYVFSLEFLGLLLDVVLVILYFIIVRNVEVEQRSGEPRLAPATAVPESRWLWVVFGVYAFWDLTVDVFSKGCIPQATRIRRSWKAFRAAIVSMFASAACLLLSFLTYLAAKERVAPHQVILLDLALLSVVLLFRVAKAAENWLAPLLRVTDCQAFENPRKIWGTEGRWASALLALYTLLMFGAFDFDLTGVRISIFGR